MNKFFRSTLCILTTAFFIPRAARAYNRTAAVNYAQTWWNASNVEPGGNANHINNPASIIKTSPITGNYLWYNSVGPPNVGDNTIGPVSTSGQTKGVGEDCANFVSAALSSGGIHLNGGGAGGTIVGAEALGDALLKAGAAASDIFALEDAPATLTVGDVVIFNDAVSYHATIVVSGSGPSVTLAAHSSDQNGKSLSYYLDDSPRMAVAYHIPDSLTNISVLSGVAPSMTLADSSSGNSIVNNSFSSATAINVQASAPAGIGNVSAMTTAPSLNSDADIISGPADILSENAPPNSPGSLTSAVDLSSLQSGATVYVGAYDSAGNLNLENFYIDRTPPNCSVSASAVTCSDSNSGLCQMSVDYSTQTLFSQSFSTLTPSFSVPLSQLPIDGNYFISAADCAGNQTPGVPPAGPFPPAPPASGSPPTSGAFFNFQRDQSPSVDSSLSGISLFPPSATTPKALLPGDPNEMFGPSGQVSPGQTLSYTVQFENEGQGTAYGVYVTDVLDPNLDDTTLSVGNFQAINFVAGSTVSASYPFKYDSTTRTVMIMPGTIGPSQGGAMTISAKLKSTVSQGTVIANQAVVYFPTVFQVTPTNPIVSVVPTATQLVYTGSTTVSFSDLGLLATQVTAGGNPVPGKTINYSVGSSTFSSVSSPSGVAALLSAINLTPGAYSLTASFPGDGFYYLGSTQTVSFTQTKEAVLLTPPSASSSYPGTPKTTLTMTSDERSPLLNQTQNPKTVYLEALENGNWQPLAQSILSGTTVQFSFSMFKPQTLTTPIRARFEGDSDYQPVVSTGALVLIDTTPPTVAIESPQGGTFSGNQAIPVQFQVSDNLDPSPTSSAFFQSLVTGSTVPAVDGSTVAASQLSTGTWVLSVVANDWAGNTMMQQSSSFTVTMNSLPPRTTLIVGQPSFVNASTMTPGVIPSSMTFVTSRTSMTLSSIDDLVSTGDALGLGVAFQSLSVDGSTPTIFTDTAPGVGQIFNSSFTLAASSDGLHYLDYFAQDITDNREAVHVATVAVDNTPPISSLSIGQPQFALSSMTLLVSSITPFVIISTDPVSNGVASGVAESFVAIGSAPFVVYSGTFTLSPPDGPQTLSFYSVDHVGNTEVAKSTTVILVSTPPLAILLSPSPTDSGLCQVVNAASLPIIGTVSDLYLRNYSLDFAPGIGAISGFTLISSGTVSVSSGVLGFWNTRGLSGFQTLRLTASDFVDNVTIATMTVYVGNPALLLDIRNPGWHEWGGNPGSFNQPSGVAVDNAGNIYVADTNDDEIKIFTATGGFTSVLGRGDGPQYDQDDRMRGRIVLNKPKDVKVDSSGNIYIADTYNNRVLEVSPQGQVLLQIGRIHPGENRKNNDEAHDIGEMPNPQNGPGLFHHPSGLALDLSGNIYVSDTDNHRVEIFNPAGNLITAFNLPALTPPPNPEPDDDDYFDTPDFTSLGAPYGIAVDSSGVIYVADGRGDRLLKFSSNGTLITSFGVPGSLPGQFHRPEGVAVDPAGDCLYISDRNNDRIQRLDFKGNVTLVFGSQGEDHADNQGVSAGIVFNNPVGLALDLSGNLYVADRNNNAIEKFEAPAAGNSQVVVNSGVSQSSQTATAVVSSSATTVGISSSVVSSDGESVAGWVSHQTGGVLQRPDGSGVIIPPEALPQDLQITITTPVIISPLDELAQSRQIQSQSLLAISTGVEYGPTGTVFQVPVTITLPYDPIALAAAGLSPQNIQIYWWNSSGQIWQAINSTVDASSNVVIAQTSHFSLYQVLGAAVQPQKIKPLVTSTAFAFVDLYAFPNPARGSQFPDIRIQVGLADSVDIHIYDTADRLIKTATVFNPQILDDGNGNGPQYTFDYIWNTSAIGSGVYIYAITAHKSGFSNISRIKKLAVIR